MDEEERKRRKGVKEFEIDEYYYVNPKTRAFIFLFFFFNEICIELLLIAVTFGSLKLGLLIWMNVLLQCSIISVNAG